MARHRFVLFLIALSCFAGFIGASPGDADPVYQACVGQCEKTGCVGDKCFQHCTFSSDGNPIDGPWYLQEPLYIQWKQWDCRSDCRYHCMLSREEERQKLGYKPVKYHGKWPFKRIYGIQFSTVAGLPSAVALLGYSLILAIIRAFNVRLEAARVMIAAPLIAFVTTHILYLNFYQLDYGTNEQMCLTEHESLCGDGCTADCFVGGLGRCYSSPSRWKVWVVVLEALAMLLEIYDFPPYWGLVDAHALWHATTIPLTYLWWSFIRDDSEFRTSILIKKTK
ncbi:hypothetical protein DH2020_030936 [Rehmannia glutinosa]|uniref:Post-GPI attachment to proteins factor 3 n=1 Tax=Rehmannia glutinosa TaxID=99300 RepID=A0ABR0VJC6_REHGL